MSNGTTGCSPNNYMPATSCTKTAPNYSQYGRDAVTIQCFQWLDESALPNLSGSFTGYAELDKKGVFCGFKVLSGDMPTSNASVSLCKEEPAPTDETGQSCDTPMNVQLCPETINAIKGSTVVDNGDGTVSAVNADGIVLVSWSKSGHTVVDNGDGTVSAIDAAGSVITTWDKTDTNTTYTYSLVGDVFTATGSDGSVQTVTITHPPQTVDTDTVLGDPVVNSASGLVTWPVLDLAGNPTGDTRTGDFSGFISSPHPTIAATGDATAAFDAATNEWSIGFTDTDTDTFATVSGTTITDPSGNSVTVPAGSTYNAATNSITTSDGAVVPLATDTDTFATHDAVNNTLVMADGSVVPLGSPDTNTTYTLTKNAAGESVLTGSDGSVQTVADADTNTTSTLVVDAASRSYVHSDGDGNDTALPVATALPCVVSSPTGLVDDKWVSDFQNRTIVSDSVDLAEVTTPCNRSAVASSSATISGARSASLASGAVTLTGSQLAVIASRESTLTGIQAAIIGANAVDVTGSYGITSGTGNDVNGNRNLVGGLGSDIDGQRMVSWGNSLNAAGAENGALFGSANTDDGLNNLTSGASNTNTGTGTLLTGNGNSNTGFANLVGGNINDNAGDRGLVTGGGNTIESGAIANTVANGQNTIRAGSVGCNAWGRGNEVTAPLYANVYGQYTIAPGSDTTVWGYAGAAPAATSNRSVEIDHPTGNITTTGTLTTSAVFAGIGEKAIVDKKLPEGSLVVFEGLAGVREAKEGELPDGVTTKALVMSIGGGIDPDNAPWLLDSMGNKLFEEIEVVEEFETVDKDATEKLKEKAREAYEKTLAKAESDEDKAAVVLEEVVALFKKVSKKSKVNQTVKNPKYDPTKLVETENVEMLGRQWAINPNGLKVGEHMTGGHIAGRGFRVLAVKDDMALLLVGCSVGGEAVEAGPVSADGILAVDNFQDIENVPFSLKLRNTTGDALSGVTAVIENVPYSTIENVKSDAKITHTVTKDGTGYTHTFELLESLAAYASVNIDGDKLDAFGVGKADGNPKLYIK